MATMTIGAASSPAPAAGTTRAAQPGPTATSGERASRTPASSPTPRPTPTAALPATAEAVPPVLPALPPATPEAASPPEGQVAAPVSLPVRLVIPRLKIDAPVVRMGWHVVQTASGPQSEWVIPKNEAGHHIDSASLGEQGNLVISGHNNIFGQVFRPISLAWDDDRRTPVDRFTDQSDVLNGEGIQLFDTAGRRHDYTVTTFYRLRDTGVSLEQRIANARFMLPTEDARLTLITCWPPDSNTHRLIVIAVPVQ